MKCKYLTVSSLLQSLQSYRQSIWLDYIRIAASELLEHDGHQWQVS
jgi:hypothetical protein